MSKPWPFQTAPKRCAILDRLYATRLRSPFSNCPWLASVQAGYAPHGGTDEVWLYAVSGGGLGIRVRTFCGGALLCGQVCFNAPGFAEIQQRMERLGAFSLEDAKPNCIDGLGWNSPFLQRKRGT